MSLGEDLMKMSIQGSSGANDPAAEASKQGKVPTLGEVQKSLKVRFQNLVLRSWVHLSHIQQLIKTLIQATTHMETLPSEHRLPGIRVVYDTHTSPKERRFATFKLFYTDKTPADYEPKHFCPGDSEKDKFFFTTHSADEIPEKTSVGTLETGRHGYVDMPLPLVPLNIL